jgi:chloramphenicol 3-O phosphotransferase
MRSVFAGLEVLWVGVLCDGHVTAAREVLRPDREPGMAMSQALTVHDGVDYDLTVDTSSSTPEECVEFILSGLSTET